jgi:hypothetical protein
VPSALTILRFSKGFTPCSPARVSSVLIGGSFIDLANVQNSFKDVAVNSRSLKLRISCYRAILSYYIVAMAQFLSPAAAADPASKIDPPVWSYRHTQEEIQSYGARIAAQEPEKKSDQIIREAKLRRILRRHQF